MATQKAKMTQQGYDEQIAYLQVLKKKFQENERAMTMSYKNSLEDGGHDNAEFEDLLSIERTLVSQIKRQTERIKNIEVIEVEQLDEEQVNIGDTVKLNIVYAKDDIEETELTLTGEEGKPEENKISINSPLGSAIFKHRIGEVVSYKLNNNQVSVEIIEKVVAKKTVYVKTK